MTTGGIVPLSDPAPAPDDVVPGGALIAQLHAMSGAQGGSPQLQLPSVAPPAAAVRSAAKPATAEAPLDGLGPRGVLKAARARRKAIRRELKRHEQLKAELAELDRLIAAAENKTTTAPVRRIA